MTHNLEAFCPSSRVKSFPILPLIIFPSDEIGSCPDIKSKLLTFLKATYAPTGDGASGRIIFNSFNFSVAVKISS